MVIIGVKGTADPMSTKLMNHLFAELVKIRSLAVELGKLGDSMFEYG